MYFRYFVVISPSKRTWPSTSTNLNTLNQKMLFATFGSVHLVLEKKSKMWKDYRKKDKQTDAGRNVIRKAHFCFQLKYAKTGCDNSTPRRSATGVSVMGPRRWVLWMKRILTVGVARLRTRTAHWSSIGQILKPSTGNGDVFIIL